MAYTLYDASITVAQDALNALNNVLDKAASHEKAAEFGTAKLADDMLPFAFQVFFATDLASKLAARGTGAEPKEFSRELPDFAAMKARVQEVQDILAKVDRATIEGRTDAEVTVGMGPGRSATMKLREYVNGYVVPNLLFHVTTAYAIMRKEGVQLGKEDYLAPFISKYVSA